MILLCLNVAFALILKQSLTSSFFLEMGLQYRINAYLHLHPHNTTGGYLATLGLALGLALCIFLGLQLLRYVSPPLMNEFLRLGGVLSLLALPACWFYVFRATERRMDGIESRAWLMVEVGIVTVLAFLHLFASWRIPSWVGVVFLILHNWFWGWQFFGRGAILYTPALIFPLLGFCSSLAWAIYVAHERQVLNEL
jgi:hypothetical protein